MRVKILISDGTEKTSLPVKVTIVGGGAQSIKVRVDQPAGRAIPPKKTKYSTNQPTPSKYSLPSLRNRAADRLFALLYKPKQLQVTPAADQPATSAYQPRTIEIKITLPPLPKWATFPAVKKKFATIPKKTKLAGGAVCVVSAVLLFGFVFFGNNSAKSSDINTPSGGLTKGTPNYATLLPAGKSIESLGGWTLVSPPDRSPVYTYVDKIGTVQINVSEQPLPPSFRGNPTQQVEELARGFSATEKIMAGGTTVYIGTSIQGPQSVIFNKDKLLILVKSTSAITNDQWAAYVSSLK